jgi:hypothetical protein
MQEWRVGVGRASVLPRKQDIFMDRKEGETGHKIGASL